ncbi:MAG: hypothetical protein AB8C84_00705 [Oligoflexales bacterium]
MLYTRMWILQFLMLIFVLGSCRSESNKSSAGSSADVGISTPYWLVETCDVDTELCFTEISFDSNFGGYSLEGSENVEVSIEECEIVGPVPAPSQSVCRKMAEDEIADRLPKEIASFEQLSAKEPLQLAIESHGQAAYLAVSEWSQCRFDPSYRSLLDLDLQQDLESELSLVQQEIQNPLEFYRNFYEGDVGLAKLVLLLDKSGSIADAEGLDALLKKAGFGKEKVDIDVEMFRSKLNFDVIDFSDKGSFFLSLSRLSPTGSFAREIFTAASHLSGITKSGKNFFETVDKELLNTEEEILDATLSKKEKLHRVMEKTLVMTAVALDLASANLKGAAIVDDEKSSDLKDKAESTEQQAQGARYVKWVKDRVKSGGADFKKELLLASQRVVDHGFDAAVDIESGGARKVGVRPSQAKHDHVESFGELFEQTFKVRQESVARHDVSISSVLTRGAASAVYGDPFAMVYGAFEGAAVVNGTIKYARNRDTMVLKVKQGEKELALRYPFERTKDFVVTAEEHKRLKDAYDWRKLHRVEGVSFDKVKEGLKKYSKARQDHHILDALNVASYSERVDKATESVMKLRKKKDNENADDYDKDYDSVSRSLVDIAEAADSDITDIMNDEGESKSFQAKFYTANHIQKNLIETVSDHKALEDFVKLKESMRKNRKVPEGSEEKIDGFLADSEKYLAQKGIDREEVVDFHKLYSLVEKDSSKLKNVDFADPAFKNLRTVRDRFSETTALQKSNCSGTICAAVIEAAITEKKNSNELKNMVKTLEKDFSGPAKTPGPSKIRKSLAKHGVGQEVESEQPERLKKQDRGDYEFAVSRRANITVRMNLKGLLEAKDKFSSKKRALAKKMSLSYKRKKEDKKKRISLKSEKLKENMKSDVAKKEAKKKEEKQKEAKKKKEEKKKEAKKKSAKKKSTKLALSLSEDGLSQEEDLHNCAEPSLFYYLVVMQTTLSEIQSQRSFLNLIESP